jgi:hypothetical protein
MPYLLLCGLQSRIKGAFLRVYRPAVGIAALAPRKIKVSKCGGSVMRSRRIAFGRAALLALVLLLLAVVAVPGAGAAPAAPVRPFQATFTIHNVSQTFPDPLHILEQQAGSGNATHLGLSGFSDSQAVDLSTFPTTGCALVTNSGTLSAANGDELFFAQNGPACRQPDGSLSGHFVFTFTGGTGRFQGATGGGTVDGNNVNGVITENWTGTISF